MRKIFLTFSCILISTVMMSCGGSKKTEDKAAQTDGTSDDGFVTIFDGKTFDGWRGYGKEKVPGKWTIDEAEQAIKFNGSGGGEAQDGEGGDIIFDTKYGNFVLELEWKVSKGGNSGIFYLAQELKRADGRYEQIYLSAPEFQILDNENHPDAQLGKDGDRKSASLYDMIPAEPQNAKPFGEWNKAKIMVFKGTVVHGQNGENVLEYHLWTDQWVDMLQKSKFKEGNRDFPQAFEYLKNCGGDKREGYIGLQDHGDDVWFRNIRVKVLN